MARALRTVTAELRPVLYDALRAALDGSGPAVLPLSSDPAERARVRAALRPDEPLEDDEVALVLASSGSTGAPKGVLLTAAALHASGTASLAHLGGPGQWLLALPVPSIGGLQVVLRCLAAGVEPGTLPPGPFTAPSFTAATAALGAGRRYTALVPTQLRRLLAGGPAARAALSSYDAVLLGGAAAPDRLLQEARQAGARIVTTYGMTETSGGCVYDGIPLPGVRVALAADARVRLSGATLARGYRLRADLTAEHFTGGEFRTGDLGHRDDRGRLVVDGRADDVIVTGGVNVAPAAVEAALAEHPSVAEVAVVGRPDPQWGQRVVAFAVLRPGRPLALQQARDYVAERVSRVAAPRELQVLDALPLLPSGKVDRRALRSAPA